MQWKGGREENTNKGKRKWRTGSEGRRGEGERIKVMEGGELGMERRRNGGIEDKGREEKEGEGKRRKRRDE